MKLRSRISIYSIFALSVLATSCDSTAPLSDSRIGPEQSVDAEGMQKVVTPNGDGEYDYLDLTPVADGGTVQLAVMNRWGQEVFTSTSASNKWKGQDNEGKILPNGTYYYIVHHNGLEVYKGAITLIRENELEMEG